MSDTKEVPKQEDEAMETEEAKESTPAPVETNTDEAAAPVEESAAVEAPAKSPKKSPAKSPSKSPKKAAEEKKTSPVKSAKSSPAKQTKTPSPTKTKKKEESEDEEEEEAEEEEKKGVLDMPLVIEGKRKRESVSRLQVDGPHSSKHKAPVVAGSGTALEDIPFIVHQLEAERKIEELRFLYRICYGTMGKHSLLRKEIKKFNGFTFAAGSDEYKKKHAIMLKATKGEISHARRILGLEVGKTKEDEATIVLDFLLKPHDEGKKVPNKAGTSKRRGSTGGKTPSKKSASSSKKKTSSKETVDTDSEKTSEDEKEEEEEEEEEVKTPKKTPAKRKAPEPKGKTPAKKAKKAKVESEDEEEKEGDDDHSVTSSSDSSEGKVKVELTPSNDEIKAKIGELLGTFDLTTVSMKQMVLAVCDAFSKEHPTITERASTIKAFIKEAIKE